LVSNGGILLGLLFGAFQFYQQFENNTQAIERLTEQMGHIDERITSANLDGMSDQFRYLDDRINQEIADLGHKVDELRREAEHKADTLKTDAGYASERLATLEVRAQQQDENISSQNWSGEDLQRQVSQLMADVQGIQNSVHDVEELTREINYVKERLSALDVLVSQPAELDTSWLENEVQAISRRLTETENLIAEVDSRTSIQLDDLYHLMQSMEERLYLLERVGNHEKLLKKARA
jgi:predicted  nucleic acid-binding Zn-ribbon protein